MILNRSDYDSKMIQILGDETVFSQVKEDTYKHIIKLEDKNNRIVDQLLKSKCINDSQKQKFRAVGSRPGIMYGLFYSR